MSNVMPTAKLTSAQGLFAKALAYAQAILADPVKKAAYQKNLQKRKKVYHAALKEYIESNQNRA